MSDMSDTPREEHREAITPHRTVNARHLSRHTAELLREVGFEGRSFAIRHFGRVIGFLVPIDGRAPTVRGSNVVYEVPVLAPLRELDEIEGHILRTIRRLGKATLDQLCDTTHPFGDVAIALANLEMADPQLIVRDWGGYKLRPEGVRHVEELGL